MWSPGRACRSSTFAGEKKVSRLPRRTAIVAFSAEEVYSIAELIRRQSGGAAVVLGALSPRTRNAQVELYQNGDVDYLIATDAIGMGLNLDVDHVAFASDKKFDGFRFRKLYNPELAQIAGRAGRYMRDGTFGTTGRCPPFDAETVEALENHTFDPVRILQWRNPDLDFSSLARLRDSLGAQPREHGLVRAPMGEDAGGPRGSGAGRRHPGLRPLQGCRGAALADLPGAGLPEGFSADPCGSRRPALPFPHEGRGRAGGLVFPPSLRPWTGRTGISTPSPTASPRSGPGPSSPTVPTG